MGKWQVSRKVTLSIGITSPIVISILLVHPELNRLYEEAAIKTAQQSGYDQHFIVQLFSEPEDIKRNLTEWISNYTAENTARLEKIFADNGVQASDSTHGADAIYDKMKSGGKIIINDEYNTARCLEEIKYCQTRKFPENPFECRNRGVYCETDPHLYISNFIPTRVSLNDKIERVGFYSNTENTRVELASGVLLLAFLLRTTGIESTGLTVFTREKFYSCAETSSTFTQEVADFCIGETFDELEYIASKEHSKLQYAPELVLPDCAHNAIVQKTEKLRIDIYTRNTTVFRRWYY